MLSLLKYFWANSSCIRIAVTCLINLLKDDLALHSNLQGKSHPCRPLLILFLSFPLQLCSPFPSCVTASLLKTTRFSLLSFALPLHEDSTHLSNDPVVLLKALRSRALPIMTWITLHPRKGWKTSLWDRDTYSWQLAQDMLSHIIIITTPSPSPAQAGVCV